MNYSCNPLVMYVREQYTQLVGWCCAAWCVWVAIFAPYAVENGEAEVSTLVSALYAASKRPLWSVAVAWLVIACCTGHGGTLHSSSLLLAF